MELKDLKVGDSLIYGPPYHRRVVKVDRLTATQAICGHQKFEIKTGKLIGSTGWNTEYASVPSPKELKEVAQKQKMRELRSWLDRVTITPENLHLFEQLHKDVVALRVPA